MIGSINKVITKIIGVEKANKISLHKRLCFSYYKDLTLYSKHSIIHSLDTPNKIECQLILYYHSIEKGLLFKNTKPRFAKRLILNIHPLLSDESIKKLVNRSQISTAYRVMCQYYELHQKLGVDIEDLFTKEQYGDYKSILSTNYESDFHGAIDYTKDEFYSLTDSDFGQFSNSRKSIRNFTGELVPTDSIKNAVQIAINTPSSCNRQSSKVYLVEDKIKIDSILTIQGGMNGFTDNINQLLIVTVDRNYFFSIGERNQFYIDGGMFLMNLLYGLHFNKIACCPANWGKVKQDEDLLDNVIKIPESEKIICLVPIGIAESEFRVTLSKRRDLKEVFKQI